ncbi:hypothetical protein NXC14_CH02533 [Rhizobium sp. NXC14]|nr:hypothetical protein NXC14_CH02533 [Rhizobium sp. NXC14]
MLAGRVAARPAAGCRIVTFLAVLGLWGAGSQPALHLARVVAGTLGFVSKTGTTKMTDNSMIWPESMSAKAISTLPSIPVRQG